MRAAADTSCCIAYCCILLLLYCILLAGTAFYHTCSLCTRIDLSRGTPKSIKNQQEITTDCPNDAYPASTHFITPSASSPFHLIMQSLIRAWVYSVLVSRHLLLPLFSCCCSCGSCCCSSWSRPSAISSIASCPHQYTSNKARDG